MVICSVHWMSPGCPTGSGGVLEIISQVLPPFPKISRFWALALLEGEWTPWGQHGQAAIAAHKTELPCPPLPIPTSPPLLPSYKRHGTGLPDYYNTTLQLNHTQAAFNKKRTLLVQKRTLLVQSQFKLNGFHLDGHCNNIA